MCVCVYAAAFYSPIKNPSNAIISTIINLHLVCTFIFLFCTLSLHVNSILLKTSELGLLVTNVNNDDPVN